MNQYSRIESSKRGCTVHLMRGGKPFGRIVPHSRREAENVAVEWMGGADLDYIMEMSKRMENKR